MDTTSTSIFGLDWQAKGFTKTPKMTTHACSGIRKYEGSLKGIPEIVRPNRSNLRVERKRYGGARPSLRLGSLRSEGHRADNILKSKQDVRGPKPGTTDRKS